ncbi:telomere length regulation TEL2 family protein isoform X2 [Wolffia australiana]
MGGEDEERSQGQNDREEIEVLLLKKIDDLSSILGAAQRVEDVIGALRSLAISLFSVDFATTEEHSNRDLVFSAHVPDEVQREKLYNIFYQGSAFPITAKILLYDVAPRWLACFSLSAQLQVYDSFFLRGPACETLEALVCGLNAHGSVEADNLNTVYSNIERLLVLFLLKNNGAHKIAIELGALCGAGKSACLYSQKNGLTSIIRMSQLLSSVPDKARPDAPDFLSAHVFFNHIAHQLLCASYEIASRINKEGYGVLEASVSGTFAFVGEAFTRLCRRGSAGGSSRPILIPSGRPLPNHSGSLLHLGNSPYPQITLETICLWRDCIRNLHYEDILVLVVTPMIIDHIRNCFKTCLGSSATERLESRPESLFWVLLVEEIRDSYAVERFSEVLLRRLVIQNINDEEAYLILWMLFHRTYKANVATRVLFSEKFLLRNAFPIRCLKWILQFSVFECSPSVGSMISQQKNQRFMEIVQCMISLWSKREFIQSTSLEQQAYVTAAVGLSLERMTKEELESTKEKSFLQSILEGVSCRLESPDDPVRMMASAIALVFSRIIDPKQPLYLDDCLRPGDVIDWEFGQKALSSLSIVETGTDSKPSADVCDEQKKKSFETDDKSHSWVNPDEIVDPADLYHKFDADDDSLSGSSEESCESSLQPYDLADDFTDLDRKFSQLGDVLTALRKPDDIDGVEKALDAVESLVRASPDELPHNAGDLVGCLIRLRCSDISVEGEGEDSSEEKRRKALVALLVKCPFESLSVLNKLTYSSNVDLGQRILILDVMTEAAQELATVKNVESKAGIELISPFYGMQRPWFHPSGGPWKEVVSNSGLYFSWCSHVYERELPPRPGQRKGTSRRWSLETSPGEGTKNMFPLYAAAFMLPAMEGFDKKRHGVELLGRDFIVLGKLIYMLGTCMRCMARHPEASALSPALLDFLREIAHHSEAYVRRSVLYATCCILLALHPSYVASALIEGNEGVTAGLDWARTWAHRIAESDSDTECSSMAMKCLQLHAELALQASRALESAEYVPQRSKLAPLKIDEIVLPFPRRSF